MAVLDNHTKLVVSICVCVAVIFLLYTFYCCWLSHRYHAGEKLTFRFCVNPFTSYQEETSSFVATSTTRYLENLKLLANICSSIVAIALVVYASMLLVLVNSSSYNIHDHILYVEGASKAQMTFYAAFAIQHYTMFFIMSIICYSWGMILPLTSIRFCNQNLLRWLPAFLTFMEIVLFISLLISLIGDFSTNFNNEQKEHIMINVMLYLQGTYDILFGSLILIIGLSLFIHLSYSVLRGGCTKYSILITTLLYTGSYYTVGLSYLQLYNFRSVIISPFFNIFPLLITSFLMRPRRNKQYHQKNSKLSEALIENGEIETQLTPIPSSAYNSISI